MTQHTILLYHFCRLQLPTVATPFEVFENHFRRTLELFRSKDHANVSAETYIENLYSLDWYLCCACLERLANAWEILFAARASRSDYLLIDALRSRAARLYPRDEEKQESAITEFWSQLLVPDTEASTPILARYDGQRPLIPWLIRVFQNLHISHLRKQGLQTLPEDDLAPALPAKSDGRWHDLFREAAREWLQELDDTDAIILGLRMRYRMSQREVAKLLGVHEGTVSRQTSHFRDRSLEHISKRLVAEGWTGDDLNHFVLTEMGSLLIDEPRLSADRIAKLLAARGKKVPKSP